jgi:hypothetical protein
VQISNTLTRDLTAVGTMIMIVIMMIMKMIIIIIIIMIIITVKILGMCPSTVQEVLPNV